MISDAMIPAFEEIAFTDGAKFEGLWEQVWTNRIIDAGELTLSTGRVQVADALCTGWEDYPAFERRAPPGSHTVHVSLAEREDDWVISCAWLKFSDAKISHFEPAFFEGYEPDDGYAPGFGVDSGTAAITDADRAGDLDNERDGEDLLNAINATSGREEFCFHPNAPDALFCTRSGLGDGFYEVFWGLDDAGEPVCMVVDFGLMTVPIWKVATFPMPVRKTKLTHPVFDETGARAQVKKPWFGELELHVDNAIPRVRGIANGEVVSHPNRVFQGSTAVYPLAKLEGDTLEISISAGRKPAVPLG